MTGEKRWSQLLALARPGPTHIVDADADHWFTALSRVGPRAVAIDVEPFVAHWSASSEELAAGSRETAKLIAQLPTLEHLVFVTNSRRTQPPDLGVPWISRAGKPWSAPSLALQHPGPWAVVGDQVLTDGLLARLLGGTFVHLRLPRHIDVPWWPSTQAKLGSCVERVLFDGSDRS